MIKTLLILSIAFLLYVNASGKVSKGLQKRRKIEYQIFTNT